MAYGADCNPKEMPAIRRQLLASRKKQKKAVGERDIIGRCSRCSSLDSLFVFVVALGLSLFCICTRLRVDRLLQEGTGGEEWRRVEKSREKTELLTEKKKKKRKKKEKKRKRRREGEQI